MSQWNKDDLLRRLEGLTPNEREEALRELEQLERFRTVNPLYFYNHPRLSAKGVHHKQMIFHGLHTQIKVFYGGNQSGKTTAGLADDILQACDRNVLPPHLLGLKRWEPPFFCRILAPINTVLEMVIYEKMKELLPVSQLVGNTWEKAFDKQLRILRFKNGSLFHFMTFEQDVGAMGGATLHRVHYDEEPPWSVRKENRIRLVKHYGDEVFTETPLEGLSWSYDQLWQERGEEQEDGFYLDVDKSLGIVVVDMDENPYLLPEARNMVLQGLSKEERQARKEGKFVHFAGRIYNDFSKDDHVIAPFELHNRLNNMNIVVGIDPGIRNRAAVVYAAIDPDDKMYVFEEIYVENWTIERVCEQIHKTNAQYNILPIYYVIDPAARNKNHQTGRSDQMEYADHGIVTIAGQNAVEAGINRIKERLQNGRLFVFDTCKHIVNEFEKYRWKEQPRSGEDGKALPVKTEDHLMDALRYVAMSRPYLPSHLREDKETLFEKLVREDRERFSRPQNDGPYGGGMFM